MDLKAGCTQSYNILFFNDITDGNAFNKLKLYVIDVVAPTTGLSKAKVTVPIYPAVYPANVDVLVVN